jgi:dihydroneopterin aldolase
MATMAKITLANIRLVGHHGYHDAERELGQRFELDVELHTNVQTASQSDKLTDAVNYEAVYKIIDSVVREDRFSLLEALASDIARKVLEQFPVVGIVVRVRKASVPRCPGLGHVEIEVKRGELCR